MEVVHEELNETGADLENMKGKLTTAIPLAY